jgi:putative transposase
MWPRRIDFFERAIDRRDVPEKITIDKSGANTAAVNGLVTGSGVAIELRQSKHLNNLIEQNHRAIKRIVRPMLGFKDFDCARRLIAGIETMRMVRGGAPRHIPQVNLRLDRVAHLRFFNHGCLCHRTSLL